MEYQAFDILRTPNKCGSISGYPTPCPMANDKIPQSAQETVSAENRRFTELVESGKYGKILKDPATGDVAVIF